MSLAAWLPFVAAVALAAQPPAAAPQPAPSATAPSALMQARPRFEDQLHRGQTVDVIVEFDGAAADTEAAAMRRARQLNHDDARIIATRSARYRQIKAAAQRAVAGPDAVQVRDYPHLPIALWHLSSPAALARLRAQPAVRAVADDRRLFAVSTPTDLALINQPQAAAAGATGAGTTVAVIDAGIDLTNSAFGSCPTAGAAGCRVVFDQVYYPGTTTDVNHGTNVSGIVAEVAPASSIAMLNVFDGSSASVSDVISAFDWAISNQSTYNIVAANMSLGDGGNYTAQCSTISGGANPLSTPVANAAAAGILAVAASGNDAFTGGINFPACTPGVVSVGAVYDTNIGGVSYAPTCSDSSSTADQVTCFSNVASFMTLFAPGADVTAAGITLFGTSQATPHVSGALAALRARYPKEPLSQALARLTSTGVADSRASIIVPRINLLAAFGEGAQLVLSGSGPASGTAGTNSTYTLTVTNTGPLIATDVNVVDTLPSLASFVTRSSSSACSASGQSVNCAAGTLAVNANASFTITVHWSGSGEVYDSASASGDQIDPVPASASIAFGAAPVDVSYDNSPLPPWSLALLGGAVVLLLRRRGNAAP
ncbi:putative Subtilisin [Burkholderiales bacterium]|nr:putative Subtilisin [Burkholderiales bacterium]